jgi:hypothetical protein
MHLVLIIWMLDILIKNAVDGHEGLDCDRTLMLSHLTWNALATPII